MKRAIFTLVCFYIIQCVTAQSRLFNHGYLGDKSQSVNKVYAMGNGSWLVATNPLRGNTEAQSLIKLDDKGDTVWTTNYFSAMNIKDIFIAGSRIFATGYSANCFCPDKQFSCMAGCGECIPDPLIMIIDTAGNYVYGGYPFYPYPATRTLQNVIQPIHITMAGNHTIIAYGDSIKSFDPDNRTLLGWEMQWVQQVSSPVQAIAASGKYIYVATDGNVTVLDTFGHLINTETRYQHINGIIKTGNLIVANNQTTIYKFDDQLSIIDSFLLSAGATNWSNLSVTNGNVALSSYRSSGQSVTISLIDTGFANMETIPTLICRPNVAMAIQDTVIFLAGNDSTYIRQASTYQNGDTTLSNGIYATTYSTTGNTGDQKLTVTLTSAQIESATTTRSYGNAEWVTQISNSIMVHNTSAYPISNVTIVTDDTYPCYASLKPTIFTFITINPGDSVRIHGLDYGYFQDDSGIFQQHFFVMAINGHRSASCDITKIESLPFVFSGINDIASTIIKVYPNPTDNILNVTVGENRNQLFQLSDLTGRILLQQTITEKHTAFDISTINQGLYLYSIKDGLHNPVTGKIEKL